MGKLKGVMMKFSNWQLTSMPWKTIKVKYNRISIVEGRSWSISESVLTRTKKLILKQCLMMLLLNCVTFKCNFKDMSNWNMKKVGYSLSSIKKNSRIKRWSVQKIWRKYRIGLLRCKVIYFDLWINLKLGNNKLLMGLDWNCLYGEKGFIHE